MSAFVAVYDDDSVRTMTEKEVSQIHDMADCQHPGELGLRDIYAVDNTGKLVPIRVGPITRHGYGDENNIYYGTSPIFAGTRTVGFVHHTDH